MSLRDIQYQEDYRSGQDSALEDFFRPCLCRATRYWRAVGYFSSSAFEAFGAPLDDFVRRGGAIHLVISVELREKDYKAIEEGLSRRQACEERIERIIEEEFADGVGDGASRLAAMLEIDRLEIKVAIPKRGHGIYHEKVGVFFDDSDYVAFSGSTNESWSAFEENYECTDVYPSWDAPTRARRKLQHFEELWEAQDAGAEVFPFPEAAKRKLIRICRLKRPTDSGTKNTDGARPEEELRAKRRWRHQDEAVAEFLCHERGVLNMATGTGKTRTALKIMRSLFEQDVIATVIVCTDGNDLLDQWYKDILRIRRVAGQNLRVYRHYRSTKETQEFTLEPKGAVLLASRAAVAGALRRLRPAEMARTFLIHDEVHGLGSPANRARLAGLSDSCSWRNVVTSYISPRWFTGWCATT